MLGHGRLIATIALAGVVLLGCALSRGPGSVAATVERIVADGENEYDRIARELKAADEVAAARLKAAETDAALRLQAAKASIGKAAAMEYLASAATWTRRGSFGVLAAGAGGLIFGGFFGGVGRRGCLFAMAVGGIGVWTGYFITAHGYLVSEFISWCVIAFLAVAIPLSLFVVARGQWDSHVARRLAAKRASDGDDGRDAIRTLAVPRPVKSEIHEAWETARAAVADVPALQAAAAKLERFGLAVPTGAGGAGP